MTINIADNSPRISYSVASGVTQTSFAVPFEFFDDEDLNVYVDGTLKTLTSDYTVTGGDGSTGTVTISVTGASGGSTVVITRDIPLERTTDFPVSGAFNIVALNTELDRLIAVAADLDDLASRAITPLDYDPTVSYTLPTVDNRKGKTLAFNEVTGSVQAGPSIADTQSVADASADIALLADIQDGTVATNAITTAANVSSQIATLGAISSDITTVSGISSNVTTVASNDANVTTVAGISSNVTTVADNIADINTVADDLNEAVSEINTVATNITNVNTVGTNITNVNTTAGSINNVNTVASDITNVNTVSTNISNVNTVAGISANVTTVAGQTTNLQNVTDNLTAIQNAASNATSASNSATAAAASAAAAALSADTFDDTYLGSKASDPSLDNDGDALNAGDLYFNTTSNTLKVYSGSAWQDAAVDSSSFVQTAGDSMTGNLSFGDSDKAIFGAGSDLQIYSDGNSGIIKELSSTGSLYVQADQLVVQNAAATENKAIFATDGAVTLYHDGSTKLATTSTGIDVTGSISADGLTVSSSGTANSLTLTKTDGNATKLVAGNTEGTHTFEFNNGGMFLSDTTGLRLGLGSGGDISFYEDTGTTAKFFWDASAESLGVGTSSPSSTLAVETGSIASLSSYAGHIVVGPSSRTSSSGDYSGGILFDQSNGVQVSGKKGASITGFQDGSDVNSMGLTFNVHGIDGSANREEAMRIDSSGNVGIGTTPQSHYTGYTALDLGASGSIWSNRTTSDTNTIMMANNAYLNSGATNWLRIHANEATRYEQGSGLHRWSYAASGAAGSAISWSEAMRIDSSGNLLVGKTSDTYSVAGASIRANPSGVLSGATVTRDGANVVSLNRLTNDGDILTFSKDTTTVGSIGAYQGDMYIGTGDTTLFFHDGIDAILPSGTSGAGSDGQKTLGYSNSRFKDLYLSGGVYLGGTGSANKLDDYEEGTFTPVMADGSSGGNTATGGVQAGRYVKIGKVVYIYVLMLNKVTTGLTGSNDLNIRSLPFTAYGSGTTYQQGSIKLDRITFSGYCTAQIQQGTTSLKICENISGSAHDFVACNQVNSGGNEVLISAVYETS